MTPVLQTYVEQSRANCLAACIASILNLPLAEVPDTGGKSAFDQYTVLQAWLKERKGALLRVDGQVTPFLTGDVFYVLTGQGPRGQRHAVVAQGNDIVHDPHPEGGGLLDRDGAYFLLLDTTIA